MYEPRLRIEAIKDERRKNEEKIERLTARNKELLRKQTDIENDWILGMIRACNLAPEKIAELVSGMPQREANGDEAADEAGETSGLIQGGGFFADA